jgi:hypothetical protein
MYGLGSKMEANGFLVRKCTSAPDSCCLRQRITGVVSTISPIEENRMMRNLGILVSGE